MKKLIIIILLGLLGCGPESNEEKKYDYSVVNNSGYIVEIIPYFNGVKETSKKVIIQNGDIFNKKFTDYAPYSGGLSMTGIFKSNTIGNVTQLEFVFMNSKKIIYEECSVTSNCNFLPRNIFRPEFNDEETEVYTITPEDFQNAQDCGGNCN
jgi:hypothetical protein